MSETNRLYAHYVAAINWLVLTGAFAFGVFVLDESSVYMLLTALIALTVGNTLIYVNGLLRKLDQLDYE